MGARRERGVNAAKFSLFLSLSSVKIFEKIIKIERILWKIILFDINSYKGVRAVFTFLRWKFDEAPLDFSEKKSILLEFFEGTKNPFSKDISKFFNKPN